MTFLQCKDFLTSPDFCTLGVGRYAIKIKRPPLGLDGGYVGAKKWLFHVLKGRSPGCRYKFGYQNFPRHCRSFNPSSCTLSPSYPSYCQTHGWASSFIQQLHCGAKVMLHETILNDDF